MATKKAAAAAPKKQKTPEDEQAEHKAQRQAVRDATRKEGDIALYRVGGQGAYCDGRTYVAGEIIRRPVDILPSLTWTAVLEDDDVETAPKPRPARARPAAPAPKPAAKKKPTRAADAEE